VHAFLAGSVGGRSLFLLRYLLVFVDFCVFCVGRLHTDFIFILRGFFFASLAGQVLFSSLVSQVNPNQGWVPSAYCSLGR